MRKLVRLMNILLASIVSLVILSDPIVAQAENTCAYYSKYSGYCSKKAVSGGRYCKDHTCSAQGCYKLNSGSANSMCDSCKKQYLYDSGITSPDCNFSDCSKPKASGSFYCSSHTCKHGSCTQKILSGSKYCSSHTCKNSGCYNEVPGANDKCSSCKKNATSTTSTTKKKTSSASSSKKKTSSSSSKKKSSTGKKKSMPDCDDYDSFDDFMDDWDGCMPDGSDAEDYWENW